MQLVGSPNKPCKVLGLQLTSQDSKDCTKMIFHHLCSSQNSIDSLMNKDSLDRMEFIANKISKNIEVNIKSTSKTQFTSAKTLIIYFRLRTRGQESAIDSLGM